VNSKARFLKLIFLVAASVTFCALLTKDLGTLTHLKKGQAQIGCEGKALSSATVALNFEDYESYQKAFIASSRNFQHLLLGLAERFQSTATKVSLKYLVALQHFQTGKQDLVLDLRKLLI